MSSNTKNSTQSGGLGLTTFLFIVFLILKLTHTIDWSWWWVTAPLWGEFALLIVAGIILGTGGLFYVLFTSRKTRRKAKANRDLRRALRDYADSIGGSGK